MARVKDPPPAPSLWKTLSRGTIYLQWRGEERLVIEGRNEVNG